MSILKNLIFGALLFVLAQTKCTKKTYCSEKTTCKLDSTRDNNPSDSIKTEYQIIIDSGESGNRFYVYDLKNIDITTSFQEGNSRQIELLKCTADGGGLHNIRDITELRNNFKTCFHKIDTIVPSEKKQKTIIQLTATSGMRLLGVKNNQRVKEIFQMAYEVLKETGYMVNPSFIRVLSGSIEGPDAQFTTNIISNNMKTPVTNAIGIMDMGSGSVQLSYQPKITKSNADSYKELVPPAILAFCPVVDYLYVTTQDCYGQNEFRFMYYASIIAKHIAANSSTSDINSACLPKNSRVKLDDNFYNSICTIWQFAPSAVKIERNILRKYTLVGDGDSEKCRKEIKVLLDTRECKNEVCTFQGEFQPPVDNIPFKAINGFYFAIDNAKRLLNVDNFTMKEFINETDKLCAKSLQELAALNNDNNDGQLDDEFVERQCFLANYVIETLRNNGFSSFDNINFVRKVNGVTIGWALAEAFISSKTVTDLASDDLHDLLSSDEFTEQFNYKPEKQNSKALRTIAFLVNL